MSNPTRPDDTRCPIGDDGYLICQTDASGICRYCNLGTCAICDGPVTRAEAADARQVPGTDERACGGCLDEDTVGVPEVVAEEASCAQTVRLDTDPTIRETGSEWCGKLSAGVA